MVASGVLQAIANRQQKPKSEQLNNFVLPQCIDGTPIPVVWGDAFLSGWTVIWYGNLTNKPIYAKGK
jgi:hypothetical protein